MTELDISRVPRGEVAARLLVDAIAEQSDIVERHYLEAKSAVDLRTKAGQAKLAKFILGASNRLPDTAAQAFEGHAIMVVGVGEDGAVGNSPIEMMELSRNIEPYLSFAGPKWDIQRVPVADGREVLLIIVDPPRQGDPIRICYKSGDGVTDGAVYFRADGETRPIRAKELELLVERSRPGVPEASLIVRAVGVATPVFCDPAATLERLIDTVSARHALARSQALSPELAHVAESAGFRFAETFAAATLTPENRTPEAYERELEDWVTQTRITWPAALEGEISRVLDFTVFEIINASDLYLADVELNIYLEGAVQSSEWADVDDADIDDLLPRPPRPWGPVPRPGIRIGRFDVATSMGMPRVPSSTRFTNSGSVDIDIDLGDLRPRQKWSTDEEELVLFLRVPGITEINGTWTMTARDHHRVFSGTLTVPVAEPLDITDSVADALLAGLDGA